MTLDTLQLETPRLLLRVPRAEDLDPLSETMADEEAARFIGGLMPRSVSWQARHRSRLGHRPRLLGQGLRARGRRGRHGLGVRSPGLD